MPPRWKRWTAILLLAFAGASASASACSLMCFGESATDAKAIDGDFHSTVPATGDCPLAQLCDFAVTPVIVPSAPKTASLPQAYVAPLSLDRPYRRDADPPLKPPAA